ncbi:hypothetical protein HDK64DRAFT_283586 [Phyllosticta capitalensis]
MRTLFRTGEETIAVVRHASGALACVSCPTCGAGGPGGWSSWSGSILPPSFPASESRRTESSSTLACKERGMSVSAGCSCAMSEVGAGSEGSSWISSTLRDSASAFSSSSTNVGSRRMESSSTLTCKDGGIPTKVGCEFDLTAGFPDRSRS